jgi:glyoxylase-like metal-dependent hydrolase (beta-lactamase superfamily II)
MIKLQLPMKPIMDPASINVYLLEGEPLTLVDTGVCTEAAWEALRSQLADHDLRISDIRQVVLTHAHADHYGLAARIAAKSHADQLAHPDAAPLFLNSIPDWEQGNKLLYETLLRTGAPEDPLSRRVKIKIEGKPLTEPVEITKIVRSGDLVTQGREVWEVVDLPGHAPGIIGLYCRTTGELITSDTLLPDTNSRPVLYFPSDPKEKRYPYMADYLETLHKIVEMSIKTAWPAHGQAICQVTSRTTKWIQEHRRQADMFVDTLHDGEKTAYQVWKAVFPRVLPFDPVKGLIEVISYLDLPIVEGTIVKFEQDGLEYYQLK